MNYTSFQCKNCSLCKTQSPIKAKGNRADIVVVGMSAKVKKYKDEIPLDPRTRSGKVVDELELIAQKYDLSLYRTNLVKGAPLDDKMKLRYPNQIEIDACFIHLMNEINTLSPRIVFLLGGIVRKSVENKLDITIEQPHDNHFNVTVYNDIKIVALYHPSYLLRSQQRIQSFYRKFDNFLSSC